MEIFSKTPSILIAEDEASLRHVLKKFLEKKAYQVTTVAEGNLAWAELQKNSYDLAILDINMPGLNGFEILEHLKKSQISTYTLVMTAQDTMHNAVTAMKKGAYDYLTKPFELAELELIVDKALEAKFLSEEVQQLREVHGIATDRDSKIVGQSKSIKEIYKIIGKAAPTDAAVLITGESGTGKELVAKALHQHSNRTAGKFVPINCAAIPKDLIESELFGYRRGAFTGAEENRAGLFETAHQGTLFLDEIGDLPLGLQGKLLRVLQEREVQRLGATETRSIDVRIIAATNQDLKKLIAAGKFREDLFFRLNVIPLHLSPLRERKDDIPLLCDFFLQRLARELKTKIKTLDAEAITQLQSYSWPGNIRELENTIRRAAILSPHQNLSKRDFVPILADSVSNLEIEKIGLETLVEKKLQSLFRQTKAEHLQNFYATILAMVEKPLLRLALKANGYNQIQTAKMLGINRNTLRKKLQELQIKLQDEL